MVHPVSDRPELTAGIEVPTSGESAMPCRASPPTSGISLRTNLRAAGAMDLQTLRIGKVIPGSSESQVVVCGMGGRVIAIDGANGANGTIAAQSEDLGFGGMALALADLDGDGTDEIVFAPALAPVDAEPPDPPHQQQHSGWLRSVRARAEVLDRRRLRAPRPFQHGADREPVRPDELR